MKPGHKYKTSPRQRAYALDSYYNERQTNIRKIFAALIRDYKAHNPCVDCGENDPVCLDFDHRDPRTKSFNVSSAVAKTRKLEVLCEEISKCDIRCANCHRKRTAKQNLYRRTFRA